MNSSTDPQTKLKGSSDPSNCIFEINVGKSRIRHKTTLKLNDKFLDVLNGSVIQFKKRSMSDPTLSDIDFKMKVAGT